MIISKVGRRGQIILPRGVRNTLKIKEGDRLAFVQRGEEFVLKPLSKTLLDFRGSIPVSGAQDFAAIRRRVLKTRSQQQK